METSPPVQESSPILVDVESDCKICKASFNSIKELRSHLRYEHYCDMCNFIAPRAFRLNGHKTQAHGVTHLQTTEFGCNFCAFHGEKLKDMLDHAKTNHRGTWCKMKSWSDIATKLKAKRVKTIKVSKRIGSSKPSVTLRMTTSSVAPHVTLGIMTSSVTPNMTQKLTPNVTQNVTQNVTTAVTANVTQLETTENLNESELEVRNDIKIEAFEDISDTNDFVVQDQSQSEVGPLKQEDEKAQYVKTEKAQYDCQKQENFVDVSNDMGPTNIKQELEEEDPLSLADDLKQEVITTEMHENIQYDCDKCAKSFSLKSSLKTHILKVHENVLYNYNDLKQEVLSKKVVQENVRYDCDKCSLSFSNKSQFNRHIRSVHENVQYNCDLCKNSFSHIEAPYHVCWKKDF